MAKKLEEEEEEIFNVTHAITHRQILPLLFLHPNFRSSGQPAYGSRGPTPVVEQCQTMFSVVGAIRVPGENPWVEHANSTQKGPAPARNRTKDLLAVRQQCLPPSHLFMKWHMASVLGEKKNFTDTVYFDRFSHYGICNCHTVSHITPQKVKAVEDISL